MNNSLCPNPCETCEKVGLPILLARYAVVPKEVTALAPSGTLKDATLSGIALGQHAQYTTRLLRSGYVYVYDERYANQWTEYFVTDDGYLTKLPMRMQCSATPPKPPSTAFACARTGARPLASVISIRNPKHANTLWLSFSDVQWTDEVMQQHNAASHRAKHMTKISVSGGKIAPQPHAAAMEQLREVVTEYSGQVSTLQQMMLKSTSPFAFNDRAKETQDLIDACNVMRPQGGAAVVVVLSDPAGIAAEIAHLMEYRKISFISRSEFQRPLKIASTIASMEYALKEQAKLSEVKRSSSR
jgi:hypothetical protein